MWSAALDCTQECGVSEKYQTVSLMTDRNVIQDVRMGDAMCAGSTSLISMAALLATIPRLALSSRFSAVRLSGGAVRFLPYLHLSGRIHRGRCFHRPGGHVHQRPAAGCNHGRGQADCQRVGVGETWVEDRVAIGSNATILAGGPHRQAGPDRGRRGRNN